MEPRSSCDHGAMGTFRNSCINKKQSPMPRWIKQPDWHTMHVQSIAHKLKNCVQLLGMPGGQNSPCSHRCSAFRAARLVHYRLQGQTHTWNGVGWACSRFTRAVSLNFHAEIELLYTHEYVKAAQSYIQPPHTRELLHHHRMNR